jgi:hypothetical protein
MTITKELIFHQGDFSFDTIGLLLNKLKEEADMKNFAISHYKRLLIITIEMLENVIKYNDKYSDYQAKEKDHLPFFSIEMTDEQFVISAGNPILNSDISPLKDKIEVINSLDKEQLRELFRQTLVNGEFSKKGGAGLGLMEIAKTADSKITYSFTDINDKYSFYWLRVILSSRS